MNGIETPNIGRNRGRIARRRLPSRHIAGNPIWSLTEDQVTISCYYVRPDRMILPYRVKSPIQEG